MIDVGPRSLVAGLIPVYPNPPSSRTSPGVLAAQSSSAVCPRRSGDAVVDDRLSTLSHCVLLKAMAFGRRWSVRCRRCEPMIRRRRKRSRRWCSVRSVIVRSVPGRESTSHGHCYSVVSPTSAFSMRVHLQGEWSGRHLVRLPLEPSVAHPHESDPSIDLSRLNVGASVDKAAQDQNLHRLSAPVACCFDCCQGCMLRQNKRANGDQILKGVNTGDGAL